MPTDIPPAIVMQQPPILIPTLRQMNSGSDSGSSALDVAENNYVSEELGRSWLLVARSLNNTTYFIRFADVGAGSKGKSFAWVKKDHSRDKMISAAYSLSYYKFSCERWASISVRSIMFSRDGRELSRHDSASGEPSSLWNPGAPDELLLKAFCREAK